MTPFGLVFLEVRSGEDIRGFWCAVSRKASMGLGIGLEVGFFGVEGLAVLVNEAFISLGADFAACGS